MAFKPRDIVCLDCGIQDVIFDWEFCENHICKSCGQIHRIVGVAVSKSGKLDVAAATSFDIPIGTLFTWEEKDYAICGYSLKADNENYKWEEYVAIDDKGNSIFLSQYNGHWNVVQHYDNQFKERIKSTVDLTSLKFELWSKYKARTVKALGSFPFDLKEWKSYDAVETISPPYVLIGERMNEMASYIGTYISPSQLKKRLNRKIYLSGRIGIGANQPFYPKLNPMEWWFGTVIIVTIMVVLGFIFTGTASNKVVYTGSITVSDSTANKPIISPSFTLAPFYSALKFSTSASLNNNWTELGIDLVNEENNETKSFVIGLEYYSGYEDGYYWSEGNMSKVQYLCSAASGTYHLVLTPVKSNINAPVDVRITVIDDPPYWNNVLILSGIILGFTVALTIIKYFWEKSRWSNSSFSPYNHGDD